MLKRFGGSSKHRRTTTAPPPPTSVFASDQPETSQEEPAAVIDNNKVPPVELVSESDDLICDIAVPYGGRPYNTSVPHVPLAPVLH